MTNAQMAARKQIETKLKNAGFSAQESDLNQSVDQVIALMKAGNLDIDQAIAKIKETSQPQAERVQYEGKTPSDYQHFAGKKKLEHHFEVAHVGAVKDADSIEDLQARLTAQILLQRQANGSTAAKVAQYILGGDTGYSESKTQLIDAIEGHFATEEINPDFFTKSLANGSSLPQLAGAK